jgi:predicted nuclease of restriction endonuclease-like (RecB) superfamily
MSKKKLPNTVNIKHLDDLFQRVSTHINTARCNVIKTIDVEMVKAYWFSGRDIVEAEQQGEKRADYGKAVLNRLSERLQQEFGNGFSVSTLTQMRKFYLTYQIVNHLQKSHTLRTKSDIPEFLPNLGWAHYRILMRIDNPDARRFYEIESNKNNWSSRILQRQVNTLLYDRIAMSKDKSGLIKLAEEGHQVLQPSDVVKEPVILEFLGVPQAHQMTESKLETALISHMQSFLLELGKGFAFVGRQKTIILNGKYYYPDLVFYHTILKCYTIIDIKIDEITHGDLGQMLFYVNYYDKECRTDGDNPTIGLLLCAEKDDALVRYTLDDKSKQIFTTKYQFHLPTEKELANELKKEREHIEHQLEKNYAEQNE